MVRARSFRPPASGIFGQQDRAASMQLAAVGMDILQNLSDEEIATENARQVSNAMAALEGERGKLNAHMDDNPDKANEWGDWFLKEKDGIRQRVMKGVTTPGAREQVSNALTTTLAGWSNQVADRRRGQIWKNANTDAETIHHANRTESRAYKGTDDMVQHLSEAVAHIHDAHDQGLLFAATDAQVAQLEREVGHKIIGDRVVQNSLRAPDEETARAEIERAREIAAEFGLPENTFGPEEIENLWARYTKEMDAIEAEENAQRKARAKQFIGATEMAIRDGKLKMENGITLEQTIRADPDITDSERANLLDDLDAKAESMKREAKEWNASEWRDAMLKVYNAKGQAAKLNALHSVSDILDETEYKRIFREIMEGQGDDPYIQSLLDATKAMEALDTTAAKKKGTTGEKGQKIADVTVKYGEIGKQAVKTYNDSVEKGDSREQAFEKAKAVFAPAAGPGLLARLTNRLRQILEYEAELPGHHWAPGIRRIPTIHEPVIKTQEEYDALDDGAKYIDFKTGKPGVKGR